MQRQENIRRLAELKKQLKETQEVLAYVLERKSANEKRAIVLIQLACKQTDLETQIDMLQQSIQMLGSDHDSVEQKEKNPSCEGNAKDKAVLPAPSAIIRP